VRATQADGSPRAHLLTVAETTLWADWFYTGAGGYSGYIIVRNTTDSTLTTVITWRGTDGTVWGTAGGTLAPRGVWYYDARITAISVTMGSIEVAHDGEPQAIVGSATTLSTVTGLSFDEILMQRRPR